MKYPGNKKRLVEISVKFLAYNLRLRGHSTILLLKNQTLRKKARCVQEDSFD